MILLLLACAPDGWSRAEALAPALRRMDTDGDGRVTAAEYEPVSWSGPPFAEVDADHDGAMGLAELQGLVRTVDPVTFVKEGPAMSDGSAPGGPKGGPGPPRGAPRGAPPPGQRNRDAVVFTLRVMQSIAEEIRAVAPAIPVPDDERMEAAATLGGLDSPEVKALLAELEVASAAAGLDFPPSLKRSP